MALAHSPRIITDGLVLCLDAGNTKSYPGSGTTWTDLSGNGNNGTLTNGVGYSNSNGGSLTFDGTNDYVNIPTTSSINDCLSGNFAYELWTFPKTNGFQYGKLFGKGAYLASTGYNGLTYVTSDYRAIWEFGTSGPGLLLFTLPPNIWYHLVVTRSGTTLSGYVNGNITSSHTTSYNFSGNYPLRISGNSQPTPDTASQNVPMFRQYNRALTTQEIQQNYNAQKSRYEKGGINNPFSSPTEARVLGYTSGDYYFQSGSMSSPQLLEFQRDYYENRGWVCAFRSPYRSTATTNKINLNIPMGGLLVQRDTLDLRAAVYWSTPITYNTVGGSGNNTADSGYSPRRVILGGSGGHGIYATNQSQCNWANATGAIGAGFDGYTCGSFPNDLVWGTGRSDTPTYENRSGTWSHWITW